MVQEFFDRKPHTELNPDKSSPSGAAVQANILDRGVNNMLLLDVTPLSLGIETYGGAVAKNHSSQLHDSRERAGAVHHRCRQPNRH